MAKAPASQFYWNDWLLDLGPHALEIEGAWIRICGNLHFSEVRGHLTKSLEQWARILRVETPRALTILEYIRDEQIGNVVIEGEGCHASVTVQSRRMLREETDRINTLNRKRRERGHAPVTPPSRISHAPSSSSSSSSSLRSEDLLPTEACGEVPKPAPSPPSPVVLTVPLIPRDGQFDITQADVDQWQDTFPAVDVLAELKRLRQWNLDSPKNRKTRAGVRSHVSKWLGKTQDRASRITPLLAQTGALNGKPDPYAGL